MVSGCSRIIAARMLPTRTTGDLIDGHWKLLTGWNAVPRMLVRGNEADIGRGTVIGDFAAFAGLLVTRIHLCRPRDPEAKGVVERANGYLETSFLPGPHLHRIRGRGHPADRLAGHRQPAPASHGRPTEHGGVHRVVGVSARGRCPHRPATGVARTTMVSLIDGLEDHGPVEWRRSPQDRRKNIVEMTPKGRDRLRQAEKARREAERRCLPPLDEETAASLVRVLQALVLTE
jgi:hypothetical protein